jgi:hypothetical protein
MRVRSTPLLRHISFNIRLLLLSLAFTAIASIATDTIPFCNQLQGSSHFANKNRVAFRATCLQSSSQSFAAKTKAEPSTQNGAGARKTFNDRPARVAAKPLIQPTRSARSLAAKHPSQRFTHADVCQIWNDEGGEDIIFDSRSQDSKTKEGRLKIQGKKLKRWKEYIFRLDQSGTLTYNPPSGPVKEKRRIPLLAASLIDMETQDLYAWGVSTASRTFVIGSDTETDKREWKQAIQDTIDRVNLLERENLLQRYSSQNEINDVTSRSIEMNYPKESVGESQPIKAATLEALINHLFSSNCDIVFFKTFILTYRSFTKPEAFFQVIKQCFETGAVQSSSSPQKRAVPLLTSSSNSVHSRPLAMRPVDRLQRCLQRGDLQKKKRN